MDDLGAYFGTGNYMIVSYAISLFLLLMAILAIKKYVRIVGTESWITVALFGPVMLVLALPVVTLTNLPPDYSVPVAVTAFLLTIPVIHWVLPRFAADFQTENFGASLMLSLMVGIGTLMGATLTGQTPGGLFPPDAFVVPDAPEEMPLYLKDHPK